MTDEQAPSKTVVDPERKAHYHKTRAASGATSLNNGDPVANALAGISLEDTYAIANKLLPVIEGGFEKKYEHLNGGMQRMVLGNRIRAAVNGEGGPSIGDLTRLTDPLQAVAKKNADKVAKDKAAAKATKEAEKKAAPKKAAPKKTTAKKTTAKAATVA